MSSSYNNYFQLPTFTDDFFYPTPSTTPLPSDSSLITNTNSPSTPAPSEFCTESEIIEESVITNNHIANNNHPITTNNYISNNNHTLQLNIATHNVQGYNTITKQQLWEEYCLQHNLHIIGITETKISSNKSNKFLNTNHFTYYWSSLDNSAEGTAIMLYNSIKSHVYKILSHPGGAIAIHLYFKHDYNFRIIFIYLSSTNQIYRNNTQQATIQWIQQALSSNIHPIILGDFNASSTFSTSNIAKTQIFSFLHNNNMYDLADHTNNLEHTWTSSQYSSRIDYIWAYDSIIPFLTKFSTHSSITSTNSDHLILLSQWVFPFALSNKLRHKTRSKRRVFNYKAMTKETWEEFSNQINYNLSIYNIPSTSHTDSSLEKLWHQIQTSIIQAAVQIIPNKKFIVCNFYYTFTPKATELHNDLKTIGSIIYQTKNLMHNNMPIPSDLNNKIQYINQKHNFQINLPPSNKQYLAQWILDTKQIWKTLYNARNLENAKFLREHINTAISNRYDRLLTNPTKMINSILNRHTDPVHFDNIKTNNDLITDPTQIKSHIQQHFQQWTSYWPYNQEIFN